MKNEVLSTHHVPTCANWPINISRHLPANSSSLLIELFDIDYLPDSALSTDSIV